MKKILAVLLVLTLLCGCAAAALAADNAPAADEENYYDALERADRAAAALNHLGLFRGVGTGAGGDPDFALDHATNRHQAITMLVRLLGKEKEALGGNWDIPFTDVDEWARPYVGYAFANGLTNGTSPTAFSGKNPVTATQYITMILRALGYVSNTEVAPGESYDFCWDSAWELSDQIGLTSGEYNENCGTVLGSGGFRRADLAVISWGALDAVPKSGETLRSTAVSAGAVSLSALRVVRAAGGYGQISNTYYAGSDDELAALLRAGIPELPYAIPVFREIHPTVGYAGEKHYSEEEKLSYKERGEQFLRDAGYGEYVDEGLTPNSYFWNECDEPAYMVELAGLTLTSRSNGMSVMMKIPGAEDLDHAELMELLTKEPIFREACRYAEITEPESIMTCKGPEWYLFVSQRSIAAAWQLVNRALRSVSIRFNRNDSEVVIIMRDPMCVCRVGHYPTANVEETKAAILAAHGLSEDDVAAWTVEYKNSYYTGYYVPCLTAYVAVRENAGVGMTEYTSVYAPIVADAPEASPFLYQPDSLHFEGVEDYDLISSFSIANRAEMIEKREKYSDDSGNTYYFADNELVVYQMPEFGVMHENSEILEKEDCLAAADEALGTMIRDYESYTVTSCQESYGCYKLLMSNGKSELFYDSLTVMVGFDGVIRWLVADYCNLSEVSDEQVQAGDRLLEKHLGELEDEFVSYEYDLRFRMRNGCLLATYITLLEDPDGRFFTDVASFIL